MSAPLYVAIALCIGSPYAHGIPSVGEVDIRACDEAVWIDSGPEGQYTFGYTEPQCREALKRLNPRGNVMKMCVPYEGILDFRDFQVKWDLGGGP